MAIGNTEAIRDWMYRNWYNKEEIHKIFISLSTQDIYTDPSKDPSIPNRYVITGLNTAKVRVRKYHDDIYLGTDIVMSMTSYTDAFRLTVSGAYIPGGLMWNMTALGKIKCNDRIYNNGASVGNLTDGENVIRSYI